MRLAPPVNQLRARPLPSFEFRPDIQGLRAVAVGVVLLFHANAPFMPGGFIGVDVFFVISGYLITALLLREALNRGRVDLADFYARRIRRILPAATVVLVATLILTVVFLPPIRWQSIAAEAAAAAFYAVNWVLAGGTGYLNANVAPSPIQHFWTLSVEEQFYILWPLVLIAAIWMAGRARRRAGGTGPGNRTRMLRFAAFGALAILLPSLAWSAIYTTVNPAPAYFVTTTRIWELAVGALLAVYAPAIGRLPARLGYLLGWAGLLGILGASIFFTVDAPRFPGLAALLPTLSSAAIIAGGMNGRSGRGVGRILTPRPMQWVGDISYSLYLWHWPLIVVGTYLLGGTLRFRYGLLLAALAVIPAWLSYRFIENPFRNWERLKRSTRRSIVAGGALAGATAVVSAVAFVAPVVLSPPASVQVDEALGATALADEAGNLSPEAGAGEPSDVVPEGFTPSALNARDDNPVLYRNGCHLEPREVEPKDCVFGDASSDTTVALVGDSHAASWMPALERLASRNGWRLEVYTKSACSLADVPQSRARQPYPECDRWNRIVTDELIRDEPDLLVTSSASQRGVWQHDESLSGAARHEAFTRGLNDRWAELNAAGIPVAVLTDTPKMGIDVPECVSAHPEELSACAVSRADAVDRRPQPEEAAAEGLPDTEVLDMNQWFCPGDSCPAVIGNVLVWRDDEHFTATYARTLAGPLAAGLERLTVTRPIAPVHGAAKL